MLVGALMLQLGQNIILPAFLYSRSLLWLYCTFPIALCYLVVKFKEKSFPIAYLVAPEWIPIPTAMPLYCLSYTLPNLDLRCSCLLSWPLLGLVDPLWGWHMGTWGCASASGMYIQQKQVSYCSGQCPPAGSSVFAVLDLCMNLRGLPFFWALHFSSAYVSEVMKRVIWSSFHSSRWTSSSWCHRAPSPMCHMLTLRTRLPHFPNLPSAATPKAASVLSLEIDKGDKYISAWQAPLSKCRSRCTQAFITKMLCIYSNTKQKRHHWLNRKILLT